MIYCDNCAKPITDPKWVPRNKEAIYKFCSKECQVDFWERQNNASAKPFESDEV